MNVLVVGAGIAGQTLGCALARRKIGCELVELKTEFDVIGAGMYVQANALRAFGDIGVVPAIRRAGWEMPDDFTDVADAHGKVVANVRYLRIAGPDVPVMVPIQRRALHDVLADAVKAHGVPVRMGTSIETLDDDGKAVKVRFTDGKTGRYDLVVGADGIRSKVRQLVFPEVAPAYSGFSNWRVILPRPTELKRPTWCFGRGKSVGIVPLSRDTLYIAGVSKEPGNPRFPVGSLHELCRNRFQEFGGLPGALLAQVTRAEQVVYTGIEQVALARPWHRGRVVVLGDAAHASTPFWSQGAAMAVEDVVLLARLLAAGNAIDSVLAEWMERRYERCRFVQEGSLGTGQRSHGEDSGAAEAVLDYARNRMQADVNQRYARLSQEI